MICVKEYKRFVIDDFDYKIVRKYNVKVTSEDEDELSSHVAFVFSVLVLVLVADNADDVL